MPKSEAVATTRCTDSVIRWQARNPNRTCTESRGFVASNVHTVLQPWTISHSWDIPRTDREKPIRRPQSRSYIFDGAAKPDGVLDLPWTRHPRITPRLRRIHVCAGFIPWISRRAHSSEGRENIHPARVPHAAKCCCDQNDPPFAPPADREPAKVEVSAHPRIESPFIRPLNRKETMPGSLSLPYQIVRGNNSLKWDVRVWDFRYRTINEEYLSLLMI